MHTQKTLKINSKVGDHFQQMNMNERISSLTQEKCLSWQKVEQNLNLMWKKSFCFDLLNTRTAFAQ